MNNLRRIRRAQDLTLQELADKCDASKSYIWDVENEESKPGLYKAYDICEALDCDIYEVFPRLD